MRLILVWMLMTKVKIEDIVMFIGDIKGAFLNAQTKDNEFVLALPPPEWKPSELMTMRKRVI